MYPNLSAGEYLFLEHILNNVPEKTLWVDFYFIIRFTTRTHHEEAFSNISSRKASNFIVAQISYESVCNNSDFLPIVSLQ